MTTINVSKPGLIFVAIAALFVFWFTTQEQPIAPVVSDAVLDGVVAGAVAIDFSSCEYQTATASWEGLQRYVVLGDSKYDGTCHTLIYTVSALGEGAHKLEECWVPGDFGVLTYEERPQYDDVYSIEPIIPAEFCETVSVSGSLEE